MSRRVVRWRLAGVASAVTLFLLAPLPGRAAELPFGISTMVATLETAIAGWWLGDGASGQDWQDHVKSRRRQVYFEGAGIDNNGRQNKRPESPRFGSPSVTLRKAASR